MIHVTMSASNTRLPGWRDCAIAHNRILQPEQCDPLLHMLQPSQIETPKTSLLIKTCVYHVSKCVKQSVLFLQL